MQALTRLARAFDTAADRGTPLPVWWRDDDAVDVGPRLERTMALAADAGATIALAVIPAGVTDRLLTWTAGRAHLLQHGVAHTNHQRTGKSAELGNARRADAIAAALIAARAALEVPHFVPTVVPPWNRMRDDLAPHLAAAGYTGVSLFGAAPSHTPLTRVDTHIDPVAWRTDRSLATDAALCDMVDRALGQGGPIGLLTHHAVETDAVHDFVKEFVNLVARHPGAAWTDAAALFAR
ncbi:hypothetical protein ATO13_10091 [Stappia sp. 22II-S9-Z10]|nr:hypothetical protein ATO13_10091 [Stappia sp. 22II-S9-Z10]